MTVEEKQFAIDLLRALDEGIGVDTKGFNDSYYEAHIEECHREIKRTIKVLLNKGYKKLI